MSIADQYALLFWGVPVGYAVLDESDVSSYVYSEQLNECSTHKILAFHHKEDPSRRFALAVNLDWSDQQLQDFLTKEQPADFNPA